MKLDYEFLFFENNGEMAISQLVDQSANDSFQVFQCCKQFAEKGDKLEILPKIHFKDPLYKTLFGDLIDTKYEGKCPDFKVNGKFYEFESYGKNIGKQTLSNMLQRGLKQSSRIIIRDEDSTLNHFLKLINLRRRTGQNIDEVWIYSADNQIYRVY